MKTRTLLVLGALILMGAPCAQEDHDHHDECPPAAAPDAGDLQSLCQEQFPPADAGPCPQCDECSEAPTMGVHEPGMVHNLVLGHLVDWAETADIKRGDPDDAKIDAIVGEAHRMACARKLGDCATLEAGLAEMAAAFKAANARRVEGQPLSAVFLSAESITAMGDDAPPAWAVTALQNLEREIVAGDKTIEELHGIIAEIGMGEGEHNGGDLGRVIRSVGKDSLSYWESMAENGGWEGQIHRHWLMTDIGFGIAFGASGVGLLGAGALSAVDWALDRYSPF